MQLKRILLTLFFSACSLAVGLNISTIAIAIDRPSHSNDVVLTAETSNPNVLGWMKGSPPPPDKIIRFDNGSYFEFPQMRWSV